MHNDSTILERCSASLLPQWCSKQRMHDKHCAHRGMIVLSTCFHSSVVLNILRKLTSSIPKSNFAPGNFNFNFKYFILSQLLLFLLLGQQDFQIACFLAFCPFLLRLEYLTFKKGSWKLECYPINFMEWLYVMLCIHQAFQNKCLKHYDLTFIFPVCF